MQTVMVRSFIHDVNREITSKTSTAT